MSLAETWFSFCRIISNLAIDKEEKGDERTTKLGEICNKLMTKIVQNFLHFPCLQRRQFSSFPTRDMFIDRNQEKTSEFITMWDDQSPGAMRKEKQIDGEKNETKPRKTNMKIFSQ